MSTLYHSDQPIPPSPGIYRITCTSTGKIYIGSAANLLIRHRVHSSDLQRNVHHNPKLQRAWNKYGSESFVFEILELVLVPELLTAREQYWMDTLKPFGKRGFNIARIAGSNRGQKRSPEAREKMRLAKLGKKLSEEHVRKSAESRRGMKCKDETKEKIRLAATGRPHSPETREKLRRIKLGTKHSEETRRKVAEASRGRTHTPETMKKLSTNLNEFNAKRMVTLIVIAPDGTEYLVHGLYPFCKQHNLSHSNLMRVAKGERAHHKGWKAHFPATGID